MKKFLIVATVIISGIHSPSQNIITPFEKRKSMQTATYYECIKYYTMLDKPSNNIGIKNFDTTDAGYPLQLVMFCSDKFNPAEWHRQHKIIILINNGIHPGEPDGVDATMMLLRDIAITLNKNTRKCACNYPCL